MIKARGQGADGPIYILGLCEKNVEKLIAGDPIVFDNKELGYEGTTVIMYGTTEEEITEELSKHFKLPS